MSIKTPQETLVKMMKRLLQKWNDLDAVHKGSLWFLYVGWWEVMAKKAVMGPDELLNVYLSLPLSISCVFVPKCLFVRFRPQMHFVIPYSHFPQVPHRYPSKRHRLLR